MGDDNSISRTNQRHQLAASQFHVEHLLFNISGITFGKNGVPPRAITMVLIGSDIGQLVSRNPISIILVAVSELNHRGWVASN